MAIVNFYHKKCRFEMPTGLKGVFAGFFPKSLHLILTPGSLLHGVTKLRILILLLHLSINLLYECSPLADLTSATLLRALLRALSCATSSCAGHIILNQKKLLLRQPFTQNSYIAWKHHLFSVAAVQMPASYLIAAALQIPQEHSGLRIPVIKYA
jgi:hypothetical protein